ncbi:MAG TPA: acyl carrier protein [Clostridiales bacterium]|jgi:acyl carrier protein|nr:acyl carrier protein [Clostridiales bacterium]
MVFSRLKELLAEQFMVDEDEITLETSFVDDLGADSLDIVELTMALEEEFDITEISEEDISKLVTVGDVVRYISERIE